MKKKRIPRDPKAPPPHAALLDARGRLDLNRQLNAQTRRVLGKHYMAKYGVK